jgi:hypothetical protein
MVEGRPLVKVMLKNDEVMVDEIAQVQVKFRNARDRTDAYYQKAAFLIDLLRNRPQGGKVIIFVQVCLNVISVACASIALRTQRDPHGSRSYVSTNQQLPHARLYN